MCALRGFCPFLTPEATWDARHNTDSAIGDPTARTGRTLNGRRSDVSKKAPKREAAPTPILPTEREPMVSQKLKKRKKVSRGK